MRLPDPQRSRAVLIGTGRYADDKLPDLLVVGRTIRDLAAALTHPVYGIVPKNHCTVLKDQRDIGKIGRHLKSAAGEAEDLLLVYFVGHGLISPRRHELYLGLPDSEWAEPEFNSLEYDKLRSSVLNSPAATKITILDCCFSGRAVSEAMADPVTEMVGQIEIDGTYVLASAGRDQVALILPGEDHTAFTGRFLHLIRNGVSGGPEFLTVDYLYRQLAIKMKAAGLSEPQKRVTSTADLLALAGNRAFATDIPRVARTARDLVDTHTTAEPPTPAVPRAAAPAPPPPPAPVPSERAERSGPAPRPSAAPPKPTGTRRANRPGRPSSGPLSPWRRSRTPAAPSAARPPIQKGAAFAGAVAALLAGVAGLIAAVLNLADGLSHRHELIAVGVSVSGPEFIAEYVPDLAVFLVAVVVAVTALMQRYRLVIIAFLLGLWWLAMPLLAADIAATAAYEYRYTGSSLAISLVFDIADALGVIAVIILMVAWRPAADRRRAPQVRALPVTLLGAVGLSQIAALIFNGSSVLWTGFSRAPDIYVLAGAGVLAALAVAWYAMSLQARALGGAVLLGWVTATAILLIPSLAMRLPHFTAGPAGYVVGAWCLVGQCVLIAAVVVLAIIYVRGSSDVEGSAPR